MGFKLSYVAIKARTKAAALRRLGFNEVGEASDEWSSAYSCAVLPGGWAVLIAPDDKSNFALDEALTKISSTGAAIGVEMNEGVMVSRAVGYEGGVRQWSVVRNAEKDPDGVAVEGTPPAAFHDVKRRLETDQAADARDVDHLFDIPIELAARLCGYRPDIASSVDWIIVEPAGAKSEKAPVGGGKSLRKAIAGELVPLLASLGFDEDGPQPRGSPFLDFERNRNGLRERLWLQFSQAKEVYILVDFAVLTIGDEPSVISAGKVRRPRESGSLWRRFLDLAKQPEARDPIEREIAEAREDILALDAFMKGGERGPRIFVDKGSDVSPGRAEYG